MPPPLPPTRLVLQNISQNTSQVLSRSLAPIPPDHILIRTAYIALNPTDWKSLHHRPIPGSISGCDFAGTVVGVGADLTRTYAVGDRVAGMAHGMNAYNAEDGAFAEYVLTKTGVTMKVPRGLGLEEASTLGVGITTVGQALNQALGLALPDGSEGGGEGEWVFIYGGSTATGSLAIQMARLAGYRVVSVAGERNHEQVKGYGAEVVLDYKKEGVGKEIRELTGNKLTKVFDTIGEHGSTEISMDALASEKPPGGKLQYSSVSPLVHQNEPRNDVEFGFTYGYRAFGEKYRMMAEEHVAPPEDYTFATKYWGIAQKLFEENKLRTHPTEVREGGLEGVLQGLKDLRELKISGVKLVYKVGGGN